MRKYPGALWVLLLVPSIAFGASLNLLAAPWHLGATDGADEKYQSVSSNVLQGHQNIDITYNLHGLCVLGGDASGFIFDQSGWKLASIVSYGQNCLDGIQAVTIPLSAFGVDTTKPLDGKFHARFWHQGDWNVDIASIVLDAVASSPPPEPIFPPPPPPAPVVPQHIVMVVEESKTYEEVIKNPSAPHINALANQYALATNFYGETHPSIGNYFELTTGNIITNDDDFSAPPLHIDNLARQLVASGKTWKAYVEDLPSVGYVGGDTGGYVKHHNPFAYLHDVADSAQKNNMVPFSQFALDLANNNLPNFALVIPNGAHNGHDGTVAQTDEWFGANINSIFGNPTFQKDGLLILTWDEGDTDNTNGGGHIATIFAGQNVKTGYQSTTLYHHQSLLRLVVKSLGLRIYPGDASSAPDMDEFFR